MRMNNASAPASPISYHNAIFYRKFGFLASRPGRVREKP
jgi:hypothetical protein